jgi:hypothetical protein
MGPLAGLGSLEVAAILLLSGVCLLRDRQDPAETGHPRRDGLTRWVGPRSVMPAGTSPIFTRNCVLALKWRGLDFYSGQANRGQHVCQEICEFTY